MQQPVHGRRARCTPIHEFEATRQGKRMDFFSKAGGAEGARTPDLLMPLRSKVLTCRVHQS